MTLVGVLVDFEPGFGFYANELDFVIPHPIQVLIRFSINVFDKRCRLRFSIRVFDKGFR